MTPETVRTVGTSGSGSEETSAASDVSFERSEEDTDAGSEAEPGRPHPQKEADSSAVRKRAVRRDWERVRIDDLLSIKRSRKFRIEPFSKGAQAKDRVLCLRSLPILTFFTASETFLFSLSPLGGPKYCPKRKSYRIESALRERPLLQVSPALHCRAHCV